MIKQKKEKQKKAEEMKTSEIIDEVYESYDDDDRFIELEKELESRPPFDYMKEEREEMEGKIESLEKQIYELQKHSHVDGKVVTDII